ncbi:MAG: hypothetical protein IT317_09310 [Anaerolineales bacterium]|nr:hypothetical protein [Anaerolineales bacterium]
MTPPAWPRRAAVVAAGLLLPLALGALVVGLWQRGWQAAFHGPYGQPVNNVILGELLAGACPGQTFVADAPGLYRIDVMLATYQRANTGPLVLHVRAAPFAAADWATVTSDMHSVADNAFHAFTFQPLPLPAGVPAYFCLEAPAARPGNAITLLPRQDDAYPGGRALWPTGEPMNHAADLTFRLYYQPGAAWAVAAGLERLAAGKPGLLGRPETYVLLLAIYLGLVLPFVGGLAARVVWRWPAGLGTDQETPPA